MFGSRTVFGLDEQLEHMSPVVVGRFALAEHQVQVPEGTWLRSLVTGQPTLGIAVGRYWMMVARCVTGGMVRTAARIKFFRQRVIMETSNSEACPCFAWGRSDLRRPR